MNIESVLKSKYPSDIIDALLAAYFEIEQSFSLQRWKSTELDAGHFVEAARRLLEHDLFGVATPLSAKISSFTDVEIKRYENAPGDESLRMLIPRILKSIYNIRNKRGIGHLGVISANEMDSTLILYSVKWVLAEFVRLSTGADPNSTQKLIDTIVERQIAVLWKQNGIVRILEEKMSAKDQVMVLLFDSSPMAESELQSITEYRRTGDFKKILGNLHKSRLIDWTSGGQAFITPRGVKMAEAIVQKYRR